MDTVRIDRRRFLGLGVLGGAATLLAPPAATAREDEKTKAEALLLSCMDYRLIHATERYMAGRKLQDKYYHVILAGASLGAVAPPPTEPAWKTTFWTHLATAIDLTTRGGRPLRRMLVIDHRDCGAYELILGRDCCTPRAKETDVHAGQLRELRKQIVAKYASMEVELFLMDLDGKVETIT
jgi:hypothetical protein